MSPVPDTFNYVVGTQTFGVAYQFTRETKLVETARAILEMGSNTLKFGMGRKSAGENPAITTLTELARDEPSCRQVLDMPFAHYLIWVNSFTGGWWNKGYAKADQEKEYREIRDLATYLLRAYRGTGKTFYLGHWEGDWYLRPGYNVKTDDVVTPEAIRGMIDWLNVRQKAVDDAKRETPHEGVQVYVYTEVNQVRIAMQGRKALANDVLPHTNVDYVSYSSYDVQGNPDDLRAALDYIESKLPEKPGIPGKRVFIGEYGFPAERHSPERQEELSRQVMRVGLEWGCPFVLYWEIYNNEVKDGKQRGFWMIDDQGAKQPIYHTHRKLYEWAREYVADFRERQGRAPTAGEYGKAAAALLAAAPASPREETR